MGGRLLVTGHGGYLGSVMAPCFKAAGFDVVGLDTFYFEECTLGSDPGPLPSIRKDLRDVEAADVRGFDAIVHLAALSNDPVGNLNPDWTREINLEGSIRLAELARSEGVERFLFSSSCIMYGMSEAEVVTEESPLDPQTAYAASKVDAEHSIVALTDSGFAPTFLRNGTIYGLSPRMRLDTVLNDLVATALVTGRVVLQGDGTPWRPVVHIDDVARAFLHLLRSPLELVRGQAFNTGSDHLNCTMADLARYVVEAIPGTEMEVLGRASADLRTYRADFGKFARTFPDFSFRLSPQRGARILAQQLAELGFGDRQLADPRMVRLKWLQTLIETRRIGSDLRWSPAVSTKLRCDEARSDHRI